MTSLPERTPDYITRMADGTVKQLNPFAGTEVWTVPGRGHRPLGLPGLDRSPIDPERAGRHCAFCEQRYLETPPEKWRLICTDAGVWASLQWVPAADLFDTVAEFRRIPNLFEILSYEYWHQNYGYEVEPWIAERRSAYLRNPAGFDHVMAVVRAKLRAAGREDSFFDGLTEEQRLGYASGFFGGGHDVIVARRHFVDGARDASELCGSGDLTPDEHRHYIRFSVDSLRRLYEVNRYVRYVAVFQNWLKPAGASFDHLHKQLVSIDERGTQIERVLPRLRANPNLFNEAGPNYASYHNLAIAENEHAIAFAGFGHRFPAIELYSKSPHSRPWEQSEEEIDAVSDLLHALHAATGSDVPCNEEWHHRPPDVDVALPWRINLKWRVSTLAGFEGGTKIYLNTVDPFSVRERVVAKLFSLREQGLIAPMHIAGECSARPNVLRYNER